MLYLFNDFIFIFMAHFMLLSNVPSVYLPLNQYSLSHHLIYALLQSWFFYPFSSEWENSLFSQNFHFTSVCFYFFPFLFMLIISKHLLQSTLFSSKWMIVLSCLIFLVQCYKFLFLYFVLFCCHREDIFLSWNILILMLCFLIITL